MTLLGSEWREETLAFHDQIRALMAARRPVETGPPDVTRRER